MVDNAEAPVARQVQKREPIEDRGLSMKYLGVEVLKSENIPNRLIPPKDKYKDIIQTKATLEIEQRIALAIRTGRPLHLVGQTEMGKTTLPKKIAADLGYWVYEIGGQGYITPVDLLGEPGSEGPFTAGLRSEPGVKKMILVNEAKGIQPDAMMCLYGAIDALEKDAVFTIHQTDGSPDIHIQTKKADVVIIFTSNEATKRNRGNIPFSEALVRRIDTYRVPKELDNDNFDFYVDSIVEIAEGDAPGITEASYLDNREVPLTNEELMGIKGMPNAINKYKEFHKKVKQMIKDADISDETHGEPVVFGDLVLPKTVIAFMKDFCPVNDEAQVIATLQRALRFFYANSLDGYDRKQVEDVIDSLGAETKEHNRDDDYSAVV